jgi:D-alanyl-D-alanine carboxypeptidase
MPFEGQSQPIRHRRPISVQRLLSALALLSVLLAAACGPSGRYGSTEYGAPPSGESYAPTQYYPPPGPPDDPWGPYIREAARHYGVPEQWIRAVMKQESDGQEQATSPVGAMGLMQVMPSTYEGLRERYGLGADPYDPHNNILAGTAYIREMYDRFGAPGFLAAYNAGPDRVESYLAGGSHLPDETVNYLAAVTPNLGVQVAMSGPLATYAGGGSYRVAAGPSVASLAAGCDLNAAYDPNHPCTSLMRAARSPAPVQQAMLTQTGPGGCNLSAAYDPSRPCTTAEETAASTTAPQSAAPAPVQQAMLTQTGSSGCDLSAAYDPDHPCTSAGQALGSGTSASTARVQQGVSVGCDVDPDNPAQPCRPPRPARVQLASAEGCDLNAALDPGDPCRAVLSAVAAAPTVPRPAVAPASSGGRASARVRYAGVPIGTAAGDEGAQVLALPERNWAIQVGAFANPALARAVAEAARAEAPGQLRGAAVGLPPISDGGAVLYRARLVNLSASGAANACTNLNRRQLPCVVVQPHRG